MIPPIPIKLNDDLKLSFGIFFEIRAIKNKVKAANIILYHTNKASFKEINLPNTPVNPAKKIAACN
jgi:hypothetical protein